MSDNFTRGDLVFVNGNLYKGRAWVLDAYNHAVSVQRLGERVNQTYPQVAVITTDGKVVNYNGDDLAQGKVNLVWKSADQTLEMIDIADAAFNGAYERYKKSEPETEDGNALTDDKIEQIVSLLELIIDVLES